MRIVLIFLASTFFCPGISAQISSITTYTPRVPIENEANISTSDAHEVAREKQFYNGLGRKTITTSVQSSPEGYDMSTWIKYDNLGRPYFNSLPYKSAYNPDFPLSNSPHYLDGFYTDVYLPGQNESHFYTETIFENSPLNRPVKQLPPGSSWGGSDRGISFHYYTNTNEDEVPMFHVRPDGIFGEYIYDGNYPEHTLIKTITEDENDAQTIEFKDVSGNVVYKKVNISSAEQVDNGNGANEKGFYCTVYIYDEFGLLRCVVQPKAVALLINSWNFTQQTLEELCFRYAYDERNRMIAKQTPGAKPVYMVYDKYDRLVLTQDGNLAKSLKWLYTKYDHLNRPVETGLWENAENRQYHANIAEQSNNYPGNISDNEVLTQTFYDDYEWVDAENQTSNFSSQRSTVNDDLFSTAYQSWPYVQKVEQEPTTLGQVTGTKVKVLGTSDDYLYSSTYYDFKGRPFQTEATNLDGGKEISTTQFDFFNYPAFNGLTHSDASNTYRLDTKYSYDHEKRLTVLEKSIRPASEPSPQWHNVSTSTYDALSRVQQKNFNGLAKADYSYNVRGWLLGINRNSTGEDETTDYFCMELSYDKPALNSPADENWHAEYTGNISQAVWKMYGDQVSRKYGYRYDECNRLLKADFRELSGGNWATDYLNFSVKIGDGEDYKTAYDANGNILLMSQMGYKPGGSIMIDNLYYYYDRMTNKLQGVSDFSYTGNTGLGDFYDRPGQESLPGFGTKPDDYGYDANGNLYRDDNKRINDIEYNYLNLPHIITMPQGTIEYVYDATGNKLRKIVHETGQNDKTTTYENGFVYEDGQLSYISHEEGRIRPNVNNTSNNPPFIYDYFLKDHLGNVRSLITEEQRVDKYPVASLEDSKIATEKNYYDIQDAQVVDKSNATGITDYVNDNGIGNNPSDPTFEATNSAKLYRLNGNMAKTGLGITLKVMAGDRIDVLGKSYYFQNTGGTSGNSPIPVIDLLSGFLNPPSGALLAHGMVTAGGLNTSPNITGINSMISQQDNESNNSPDKPRAYINVIFFDEQFRSYDYDVSMVGANSVVKDHFSELQNLAANKSGYVYIYCSNESPVDVFFDNLQVVHTRGALLEENSYYPFGLTMAGISSKGLAFGSPENKYKYNGKELQSKEFSDNTGLELYDFGARMQDPQLGRWWTVDPKAADAPGWTPFNALWNNPILNIDPEGAWAMPPSTIVDEKGNVVGGSTADGDLGVYRVSGVTIGNFDAIKIEQYKKLGTRIGETYSLHSFQSPSTGEWMGHVSMDNSAELAIGKATQTLGRFMLSHSTMESLIEYMEHAGNFKGAYDLKTLGLPDGKNASPAAIAAYAYEASFFGNKIMTRRDQGNFFAGRAAKMLGLSEATMLSGFGAYQQNGNKINGFWDKPKVGLMSILNWLDQQVMGAAINGTPAHGTNITPVFNDDKVSEDLQRAGYNQMER